MEPVHADSRQILIRVWRGGWGSTVDEGRFHDHCAVSEANNGESGWGTVRGTRADMRAWSEAEASFTEAIRSAERAYRRLVDPGWRRWLPGHDGRVERAKQAYRRATAAAQATYQPVVDEIVRREAAAEAERQRRDEERRRFHEEAQANGRERDRRRNALAERAIWGWSEVDPTTVRVFESAEQGLTAAELDEALRALHGSGVRTVEWDPAARAAAARACALPGTPPSDFDFRQWWKSVADLGWKDPAEIPPPRPPGRRRGNDATFHHSDYGGGDYGGSYGASHGTSF
ncbi:hypothetical protein [Pseudonocardia sp. DLS-67]